MLYAVAVAFYKSAFGAEGYQGTLHFGEEGPA